MLTILIVDDEMLIRNSVRMILEELPFQVHILGEAEDGEEALAKYRQLMPDIMITDVKMPGMDGLELISTIRKADKRTQFVIISGYADFEYARSAMKNGVAQYVLKPVKKSELEDAVRQCALHFEDSYREVLPESDRMIRFIQENYARQLSLDSLAKEFNFNPQYISQLIKSKVNQNFTDYLMSLRLKHATELLSKTDMDIKSIVEEVGYQDPHYFHRIFKKQTGRTPVQYRREFSGKQKGTEL